MFGLLNIIKVSWMVLISFSPILEKWSLKADKSSSASLMLQLSNLISYRRTVDFSRSNFINYSQVIRELPSFSCSASLKNFSLACLISLFTALRHFLNIIQSHAFPEQTAFTLRTFLQCILFFNWGVIQGDLDAWKHFVQSGACLSTHWKKS